MGIACNKYDLYNEEQVKQEEGIEFAKQYNAIFKETSAKTGNGIDDFFTTLGKKFINPNGTITIEPKPSQPEEKKNVIQLDKKKAKNKKKGCC